MGLWLNLLQAECLAYNHLFSCTFPFAKPRMKMLNCVHLTRPPFPCCVSALHYGNSCQRQSTEKKRKRFVLAPSFNSFNSCLFYHVSSGLQLHIYHSQGAERGVGTGVPIVLSRICPQWPNFLPLVTPPKDFTIFQGQKTNFLYIGLWGHLRSSSSIYEGFNVTENLYEPYLRILLFQASNQASRKCRRK